MTGAEHRERYLVNLQNSRNAYSGFGVAVTVLLLVHVCASYGLAYAVAYLLPEIYVQWWFNWVLNLVPLYGLAFPAFFLCLRHIEKGHHNSEYVSRGLVFDKPKFHFGIWCLLAVVGFGYMYIGHFMGNGLMGWISHLTGHDYQSGLANLADTSPWWMILVGSVIIAPIGEELMFRKLLIDRARRYGDGTAILSSSLLFALFHGNLFQIFYAFFLGLIMGYMYTLSGKIRYSVALHMFINFMCMLVMPNLLGWLGLEDLARIDPSDMEALNQVIAAHPVGYEIYRVVSMAVYGAMIAAIVLTIIFLCKRKIRLGQGEVHLRREDRMIAIFGNMGMPLCIFILILYMVMNMIIV